MSTYFYDENPTYVRTSNAAPLLWEREKMRSDNILKQYKKYGLSMTE